MSPAVTGAQTESVADYRSVRSETFASAVEVGWLRGKTSLLGSDVKDLHRELHSDALRERAAIKARKSVGGLLRELGEDRGMGWSDIAELIGVSVSAIRKWRKGGDAAPESRQRLARLAGFLELLSELAVEEPAQWMEIPLATPPGYTIRPIELYRKGYDVVILDMASHELSVEDGLDEVEPGWREHRFSRFEVFDASDGQKALRIRGEQ